MIWKGAVSLYADLEEFVQAHRPHGDLTCWTLAPRRRTATVSGSYARAGPSSVGGRRRRWQNTICYARGSPSSRTEQSRAMAEGLKIVCPECGQLAPAREDPKGERFGGRGGYAAHFYEPHPRRPNEAKRCSASGLQVPWMDLVKVIAKQRAKP